MNYIELLEKYNFLLSENNRLTEENKRLKTQLGLTKTDPSKNRNAKLTSEKIIIDSRSTDNNSFSYVNNTSDSISKIKLFMSLFKGRDDVYAKRWKNKKKATSGYSPACLNQWEAGLCGKPKISCAKCANKLYAALDKHVIEDHLRGNIVVGIYPMLQDETCYFLAMDFDEAGWQNDISTVREVCAEFDIPMAVERSRSGNGGHVWFFFQERLSAALARKFGTALLTFSMNRRHEIPFRLPTDRDGTRAPNPTCRNAADGPGIRYHRQRNGEQINGIRTLLLKLIKGGVGSKTTCGNAIDT